MADEKYFEQSPYQCPEHIERRWVRVLIPQQELRQVVDGPRRIKDVVYVPVGKPELDEDVAVHHCYYDVSHAAVVVVLQSPRFPPVEDGQEIPWHGDLMRVEYQPVEVKPCTPAASPLSSRPTTSS